MSRKKKEQRYQDLFARKRKTPVFAVPVPGKRLRGLARSWRWEKGWIGKYVPSVPKSFPAFGIGHLKLLWLGLCLSILIFAFFNRASADQETAYIYGMLVLTSPAGLLVPAFFSIIVKHVYYLPPGFPFDLLLWPFFFAAGYAQWFVLPRLIVGRWRKTRG